ncbi:MAG: outer membrane lipoprotein carrier protein LolA [Cyclobacteriaceae bacterium]|nr:outer membrane lipoprotein carrier protein LolA [Cyclobacteriaceae bacterium HetDA_MAG_MS6]
MKRFSILTLLILGAYYVAFSQTEAIQYDPEAKQLLDAMSANYQQAQGFVASFSQEMSDKVGQIDESMKGTITVMGDKYKLEVSGQEIYNDGENIWTYSKENAEVTVRQQEPEDQQMNLNSIVEVYKEGYKYVLLAQKENGNSVVDLDAEDLEKPVRKIRMIITPKEYLKSFTIFQTDGIDFRYNIESFEEKADLTEDFFTFNVKNHPGVELIDFR